MKPVFTNSLYAVFKQGSRYIVTLASRPEHVQYSGTKSYCVTWAIENSLENASTA